MAYQVKVSDTGKTRGGRPYRVLATDLKNAETIAAAIETPNGEEYVTMCFANGKVYGGGTPSDNDLIPTSVYINVYERENGSRFCSPHESRACADKAIHVDSNNRIGCIRVPLEARFDD